MPLKNYIKDAPKSLKERIIVPYFGTNEKAKDRWVEIQKYKKLQDLEFWVGCSIDKDPLSFLGDLLGKVGLTGLQIKPRKKWQGKDGILLYLRVFKAKYELHKKYPDNNFIGFNNAISVVKDKYYDNIDLKSLTTRYRDIENKKSPSISNVINYLKSKDTTDEEKIAFIDKLEKALTYISK